MNDLFYLAKPMVESLFNEDVGTWLENHEIRFTPKAKFTGTSGYDHMFDFVIPKSRKEPERIIQAINRPNRNNAEAFIYKWTDTREVRSGDSKAYAVLNDDGQSVSSEVLDAFRSYAIKPLKWSEMELVKEELAA